MTQPVSIRKLLKSNLTIPTIPVIVQKINALIEDPDSGTAEIGRLIAEDAPLAAKVLRIANSAFYGISGDCVSTEQASTVLGLRVLKNIVTQVAVMDTFRHVKKVEGFDPDSLWEHSITTAQVSSQLARKCRRAFDLTPEEFYVCGLLHDVGKVVLLDNIGTDYAELIVGSQKEGMPLHVAERRRFGYDHTDVGSLIASRWGLPDSVAAAIQFHHGPRERVAENPVVCLIANTNLMVHRAQEGLLPAAVEVFDGETLAMLGLSGSEIEAMAAEIAGEVPDPE